MYGKAIHRLTDTARSKGQLPFLFKTLCAGKGPFYHAPTPTFFTYFRVFAALPLQIHPDKKLAEQMYKENPEDLPDANHKPEIGLALSEFWAFASFRPMNLIRESVQRIPELKDALGGMASDFMNGEASETKLRKAVQTILQRGKDETDQMGQLVKALAKRCKEGADKALGVEGSKGKEDQGLAEVFCMLNDVRSKRRLNVLF